MKLNYVASAPIACSDIALMGGGMGDVLLDTPLKIMFGPERLDVAINEARASIVREIRKAEKCGRVVCSIEYACEISDSADSGGVLVEGAYVQLTATVTYE